MVLLTVYLASIIENDVISQTVLRIFKSIGVFIFRSVADLLAGSKFNVSFCHGRADRNLLHIAAK